MHRWTHFKSEIIPFFFKRQIPLLKPPKVRPILTTDWLGILYIPRYLSKLIPGVFLSVMSEAEGKEEVRGFKKFLKLEGAIKSAHVIRALGGILGSLIIAKVNSDTELFFQSSS